jgi:glycosyltransferase involved in cell wall biosynthesis
MSATSMRMLHVSHTSLVSGAEHSLLDLLSGLEPLAAVRLAAPPGDLLARARARGIATTPLRNVDLTFKADMRTTARALRNAGAAARTLAAQLQDEDVMHVNSVRATLFAAPVGRARKVPVVMHVRDVLPASAAGRAVRHTTARLVTRIAAISEHVAASYCDGLPAPLAAKVAVIDNPVDLERFAVRDAETRLAARLQLGIADERPLLAIVGQISSWKGHDVAVQALSAVRARHPDAALLVVGEVKFASAATTLDNASFRRRLDRLAGELGLPQDAVRFLGERDDVPAILAATDLLLAPSTVEPFGRSLAEAMAVGVPVLATRNGGPPEFIDDDRTGWLLDPLDAPAWSARVASLFERPGRLAEVGAAASLAARARFSCDRHAAAMLELFEAARR